MRFAQTGVNRAGWNFRVRLAQTLITSREGTPL